MKQRIRLQGMLMILGCVLMVAVSRYFFQFWKNDVLEEFFDILGIGLLSIGYLFRIAARGYKEMMSAQGHQLVTGGPYALVRNPMYLGTLLIGTGIIAMLFQWWVMAVFMAVFLSIYIPQMRKEESLLTEMFGHAYIEYCSRVPRCIPALCTLGKLGEHVSCSFVWVKKEIFSIVTVVVFLMIVSGWRDAYILGSWHEFWQEIAEFFLTSIVWILEIAVLLKNTSHRKTAASNV